MGKMKYDEDFPKRAEDLARQGLRDIDIARKLNISKDTFYKYQKQFPDFADAIKKGKAPVDFEVENALLKRAMGYEYEEVHVELEPEENSDKPSKRIKSIRRVKKFIPPDTAACIFWLLNRRPHQWRDRKHLEIPPGTKLPLEIILSNGNATRKITAENKANRALPASGKSASE